MYQQVVAAYREKLAGLGRKRLRELIDTVKQTTPARFTELRKLAYTLDRRRVDILAYFDHPRTSNGPTEALLCRRRHKMLYADVWVMPMLFVWCLIGLIEPQILSA